MALQRFLYLRSGMSWTAQLNPDHVVSAWHRRSGVVFGTAPLGPQLGRVPQLGYSTMLFLGPANSGSLPSPVMTRPALTAAKAYFAGTHTSMTGM